MKDLLIISDSHGNSMSELLRGEVLNISDFDHVETSYLNRPSTLIHCGDLTEWGSLEELDFILGDIRNVGYIDEVILIAGNHDWCFQRSPMKAKAIAEKFGVTYLESESTRLDGLHIYGCPWTPMFMDWAFMYGHQKDRSFWKGIPSDIDILITHGPPMGICDSNMQGESCGSSGLRQRVAEISPKLHLFGHIHPGYGVFVEETDSSGLIEMKRTVFINSAVSNDMNRIVNKPFLISSEFLREMGCEM